MFKENILNKWTHKGTCYIHTLIRVGHVQYFIHYLFKIENFIEGIITFIIFRTNALNIMPSSICET